MATGTKPTKPASEDRNVLAARLDALPRGDTYHGLCERFNAGEDYAKLEAEVTKAEKAKGG